MSKNSARFEIDLKVAVRKLGRYLVASGDDAFLKLVQFGVSQSAAAVVLVSTPSGYCIHFLGLAEEVPAAQLLTPLVEVLTGEVADRRLPLFQGLNFFLNRGAELAITCIQGGHVLDSASSADFTQQISKFPPDAHYADALSVEVYARSHGSIEFDAHCLKQRLAYCTTPVSWNRNQLNGDREAAGCWPSYGQPIRQEFPGGQLEVAVEVKQLSESEHHGHTEVLPLQWGVTLDPVEFSSGAPGIRLIVPANEVQTQVGAFKLKPCPAWSEREAVVGKMVNSITQAVRGKSGKVRKKGPDRPHRGPKRGSFSALFLFVAFDLLIMYHRMIPQLMTSTRGDPRGAFLDSLQPYLGYFVLAQILWLAWQLRN